MDYIADLHIHSPYSRATSPESNPAGLAGWARVKGIQVVGTGDFTHPGWFRRLKDELEPAEPGLFRLKNEAAIPSPLPGATPLAGPVRFLLSAEISSIYKRHGVVRKVHNLLYVPDFASAERLNAKLAGIGNIESDGRPILGLDSRNLLEILLEEAPEGFLVPAHIWTPWFSLFGSKSGFDAIEECFDDLTPHVFALETGLSSDPDMNRLISGLDRFALISNSDCHSPSKLGREANLLATDLDFFALRDAIKGNRRDTFRGTVEFFPEEGKYHADGHRACHVCLDPVESRRLGLRCPVCGRPLTIGVYHRVMELADREKPLYREDAPSVFSLIPLPEVLGEIVGAGPASKGVMEQYARTIGRFGSEFNLLLHAPLEEIREASPILGEAVERMRAGRVIRKPGFDGEYGVIRVFEEGEAERLAGQGSLFGDGPAPRRRRKKTEAVALPALETDATPVPVPPAESSGPNPEQAAAIASTSRHTLVAAGPGTGKTTALIGRVATLLAAGNDPARMAAITFTAKAAEEVRERLLRDVGPAGMGVFVGTFHRFCLDWLRRETPGLAVVGPEDRERLFKRLFPELGVTERKRLGDEVADHFIQPDDEVSEPVQRYLDELDRLVALDLDAVIPAFVQRLGREPGLRSRFCDSVGHLFVDEFQDLNESQFELVAILADRARIFAIGDPDQAIYGFRGSDLEFFFRFGGMPGVERLSLTGNYRCPASVVAAATAVIAHNDRRSGLPLAAVSGRRGGIELHTAPTGAAEAEFIVRRIEELMGGIEHFSLHSGRGGDGETGRGLGFGDLAVLFRLGRQAEEVAAALERRGIPYQQVGVTPFYLAPEIRAAYYWVQAAAGSETIADWLQLASALPGIGAAGIGRMEAALPLTGDFFASLSGRELPQGLRGALLDLERSLGRFRAAACSGLAAALLDVLPYLSVDPAQTVTGRFLDLAGSFGGDLKGFGSHLRRYAEATVYDERAEAVALMTLHAAKGLEFPVVFLAGAEEGLLPCSLWRDVDVEEERRLFYVGLTRARERVIVTSAVNRPWVGASPRQRSRFVAEIPRPLLTDAPAGPARKTKGAQDPGQMDLF
ncbi:UvrD-helicase domain-containing protein [Geobacter sp. AOG2]|uniref:UvrD-helicase domain-containing protein n=1 Tax=Geobacter sp. AOG2 TaxID=1566347 RepID=UPI001CC7C769|nr:UvrD-helicase domain-containing protein [Geobacter sp. AOG2]GFE59455.1 DNA helicase [Geobacter sp. AOG2]